MVRDTVLQGSGNRTVATRCAFRLHQPIAFAHRRRDGLTSRTVRSR